MNQVIHPLKLRRSPSGTFVLLAWVVIVAKCLLVQWAITRWNIPVRPAVIILPTLATAALATFLWLVHPEEE